MVVEIALGGEDTEPPLQKPTDHLLGGCLALLPATAITGIANLRRYEQRAQPESQGCPSTTATAGSANWPTRARRLSPPAFDHDAVSFPSRGLRQKIVSIKRSPRKAKKRSPLRTVRESVDTPVKATRRLSSEWRTRNGGEGDIVEAFRRTERTVPLKEVFDNFAIAEVQPRAFESGSLSCPLPATRMTSQASPAQVPAQWLAGRSGFHLVRDVGGMPAAISLMMESGSSERGLSDVQDYHVAQGCRNRSHCRPLGSIPVATRAEHRNDTPGCFSGAGRGSCGGNSRSASGVVRLASRDRASSIVPAFFLLSGTDVHLQLTYVILQGVLLDFLRY